MKTVLYYRKINKNKKLIKTIKEHYTRPEMPCSFNCCETPHKYIDISSFTNQHFIIPSVDVLKNYLPLFQSKYVNAIILQSTLEEIRRNSLSDYKRILDATKSQFIFYNDFFEKTFINNRNVELIEKNEIEKEIMFNDKNCYELGDFSSESEFCKTLSAFEYYLDHIKDFKFTILTVNNIHNYPNLFSNSNIIKDLITKAEREKTEYKDYMDLETLEIMRQEGKVFKGILYTNNFNCYSGIVHSEYKGRSIRIKIVGKNDMNRAINLDGVYVEIKSENEKNIDLIDDEIDFKIEKKTEEIDLNNNFETLSEVYGKIVGIFKREYKPIIGTLDNNSINGSGPQYVLVIPLDRKIPKIRIRTSQVEELENKRIMVKINEWEKDSFYPFGSYITRIGLVGDEQSEIKSILFSNGIDYENYSNDYAIQDVIKTITKNSEIFNKYSQDIVQLSNSISDDKISKLNVIYSEILEQEKHKREDLRDLDIFSIDPPGCTDIDDALHCRVINNIIEVGIHIADVSFFVEKDTDLDKEAMKRGTTVYLTDRRLDMLPGYLSSHLCSLIENEDRLTFSVFIYFDKDLNIINKSFKKGIIRSRKSYTYEEAQNEMNNGGKYSENIKIMNKIAKKLRKTRLDQGALELSSTELKIYTRETKRFKTIHIINSSACNKNQEIGDDTSLPEIEKIEQKILHETNSLVEEFMLLANIAVANELYDNLKDCSLLRRHPKFADDSFDELKEYLAKKNIDLNYLSSKELNESIKKIEDGQFKEMIKKIITRSMNQAVYFSSGSLPYEEFLHYGLAMPIYTHFTSPIRRYADLIVHRQLEHIISSKSANCSYTNEIIEDICKNINYRNRNAMYANLECDKLFIYLYIKGKINQNIQDEKNVLYNSANDKHYIEEVGFIVRIRKNGIAVYIPAFSIEDIIIVEYDFCEEQNCFLKNGKKIFGLYDHVKVKIYENDEKFFIKRRFDLEIVE